MNYKYIKYIIPVIVLCLSIYGRTMRGDMNNHDALQYTINIFIIIAIVLNIKVRDEFGMTNKESLYPDYRMNEP